MEKPEGLPFVFPTVVHMLADAAAAAPEQTALVCEDDRLTYAEYLRCVAGFARELMALGVACGRVAIVLANSVDIAIASYVCSYCIILMRALHIQSVIGVVFIFYKKYIVLQIIIS